MNGIKDSLTQMNKSSIIVTHDPDLAINFGDIIILITPIRKEDGSKMGFINNSNVYYKENDNWKDAKNNVLPDIKKLILELLSFE